MTKNLNFYSQAELRAAIDSWLKPYPKPMLLNHNSYSGDPIGRVKSASIKRSSLKKGSQAVAMELDVMDPVAQEKVTDGRYRTLSIGSNVSSAVCSICKVDRAREWCDHYKGRVYDGKLCYWTLQGLEHEEVSVVNVPADPFAQITDVPKATAAESTETPPVTETSSSVVTAVITEFTNPAQPLPEEIPTAATPEVTETPNTGTPPTVAAVEGQTETSTPSVESLQAELAQMQASADQLAVDLGTEKENLRQAQTTIEQLQQEVEAQKAVVITANETAQTMEAQNTALATIVITQMAERVADLEIFHGATEERDVLLATFKGLSLKALREKLDELAKIPVRRQIKRVDVPGGEGTKTESGSEAPKVRTLDELANTMVNFLTRK